MTGNPRILIIDDEEIILDSCAQILEGGNYELATAGDGARGLKLIEEFRPDLVFVDLKMPGISGFQVLERVQEVDPTIVTVVITGYATVSSAVEAMKKGAYDFLPKPFTPDAFRLVARRGLEKRNLVLETMALRRERELLRNHFAAVVSHELKSPLGAVQQNLFVLAKELEDTATEEQKKRLERMKVRIDDLLRMIRAWLRGMTVDVDSIADSSTEVSIDIPISKAVETVETHAVRKDIEIAASIEEPSGIVWGDEGALTEALVNLLSNAVKYSHVGGQVSIRAQKEGSQIVVSVSDTGVGISTEELPRIFEGFYRARSGETQEEGHGLGLVITRRIIEAHRGSIGVETEVGEGSTFTIILPAHEADFQAEALESSSTSAYS